MEKKICSKCGCEKYIVNKTKCLCDECNYKRLHNGLNRFEVTRLKQQVKPPKKKKPTGELELFREIWAVRPHICTKCGKNLGGSLKPIFFSHIKSKGAFPELRLAEANIELVCAECHQIYEFGSRKNLQ